MDNKLACLTYPDDNMGRFQKTIKRGFDIFLSFISIIILLPFFIIICLILTLEGNGSALFAQERIGCGGKPFRLYKFRTLKKNMTEEGPQLIAKTDRTMSSAFQGFLRNHHIDELPQLWNILKGDMSFVGPRPELQYFIDKIMQEDPNYQLLYQIQPGLTSEAALYNGYTDTMDKMLKRLKIDLQYLRNRSLKLDLQIMFNTILSMFSKN